MTKKHTTKSAFTLVELLTAISIISILIAILLPSLSGARNRGRITKCEANLRELAHAALRYVSQHDDTFPVAADCSGGSCVFWNGHQYFGWNGRIQNPSGNIWVRPVNGELGLQPTEPASSAARIAECPADSGAPGETGVSDPVYQALGSSYPMNPILCQGRYSDWAYRKADLNLSQILQPSRKLLVADHVGFGLTFDGYWTAIRPGWHDRGRPSAVAAFIDGHAEYLQGIGSVREWQWYGEASGPDFVRQLPKKVAWTVMPGAE